MAAPRSFREVFLGQTGKLVYTLRNLLLHPGELAREIDEGRDRRAVRPLTLLLNLVAFFFVLGGGPGGFSARGLMSGDLAQALPALSMPGAPGSAERARFEERLEHRFQSIYSLLVIVQTLAYGVALRVVERRAHKSWLVHFAAATHYMCVSFLLATLAFGGSRLAHVDMMHNTWLGLLMYLVAGTYMTLMLRRVYGDSRARAIAKAVGVLVLGYVVAIVLAFTAFGLAFTTA